ncbi:PDZ domain-containing protein, partial [Nostoc sp. NIES-2111]
GAHPGGSPAPPPKPPARVPAGGGWAPGGAERAPATPADIEPGEGIDKFTGPDGAESRVLPRLVGQTPVGKEVDVIVIRKGQEVTKKVALGRLEDGEKLAKLDSGEPEKPAVQKALGLELSGITDELRKRYQLKDSVKGVVVTKVDPDSPAADKRIQAGDVIVEVQQEAVSSPDAMAKRVDALKKEGKKSALLLVSNAQGELRFVAVAIE